MFDVLDMDSSNAHHAIAQLDGEAVSCVSIVCQPVFASIGENPPYVELGIVGTCGPNYFRLEEAVAFYI